MPALRKYMLSVAPADMPGTISTLGKRWWTAAVTAAITSWRSGEAGLATGGGGCTVTVAVSSSMTLIRVGRTLSTEVPGKIRQLMLTLALCGSALSAWPPLSMVATQVVRIWPTCEVHADQVGL